MMRAILIASLALATIPAHGQRRRGVRVRVVEVAGGQAFVRPGEARGLRVGQRVRFGRGRNRSYRIVSVSRESAALDLEGRQVRTGARGTVRVRQQSADAETGEGLSDVRPLESFRGQWPEARLPASTQDPDPVPLGQGVQTDQRLRIAAALGVLLRTPLGEEGDPLARVVARVNLHAEPLRERPMSIDVDAQAQLWLGEDVDQRAGDATRPYVLVRRLELAYGRDASVALGRLRRASAFVGTLDGARVRTPSFSGFSVGAFGGLVPNPTNGAPNFDVSRFGLEAKLERPDHPLRPRAALVAHGSTFDGIDERRLALETYLYPDWGSAGGFAELSMFGSNNRWDAPRVDLTAGGLDFGFHTGPFSAHIHGGIRKPERSRFLDSLLPPEWSCTVEPQEGSPNDEPCDGAYDARHYGTADVGVAVGDRIDVRLGGAIAHTGTNDELDVGTGFAQLRVVRIAGLLSTTLTAEASGGRLIRRYGGRLALGLGPIAGMVDLSVHYGAAAGMLRADQDLYLEHRAGGSVYLSTPSRWSFRLVADALVGGPTSAMVVEAQLGWRL